jgi:hypothetical protein
VIYTHIRYLSISLLTCRDATHWCAAGGDIECRCAAKSGQRGQTTWMQTVGAAMLAVKRCSIARVRMLAHDSRSAHRLLYLAAVRGGICPPETVKATLTLTCQSTGSRLPDTVGGLPLYLCGL